VAFTVVVDWATHRRLADLYVLSVYGPYVVMKVPLGRELTGRSSPSIVILW
jgi:hypothetical protein